MKKKYIVIICIIVLLLIGLIIYFLSPLYRTPKSMDALIEYKLSDKWVLNDTMYRNDDNKTVIEKSYIKENDGGYFSVSIFCYKGYEVIDSNSGRVDYKGYINNMTKRKDINTNGITFYTGMSGMDDFDNVNANAFIIYKGYVFHFRMSNFDDFVTDNQKKEFNEILKTVKIKNNN